MPKNVYLKKKIEISYLFNIRMRMVVLLRISAAISVVVDVTAAVLISAYMVCALYAARH